MVTGARQSKRNDNAGQSLSLEDLSTTHLDAIVSAKRQGAARAGQRQLCAEMAASVSRGAHSIAEAGTGTGKTFAYLAVATAAIRLGRRHSEDQDDTGRIRRVVVVTATKALQEQLVTEDLPAVAAALRGEGFDFSYGLLKGRNNYLCVSKQQEAEHATKAGLGLFDVADHTGGRDTGSDLSRIFEWSAHTIVGDRVELDPAVSDVAWRAVSSGTGECPGRKVCSAGDVCFSELAREQAKTVDILVVNAALYASAVVSDSGICGDHELVIIDEAHEFDEAVCDANTIKLSGSFIKAAARSAQKAGGSPTHTSALTAAAEVLDTACQLTAHQADSPSDGVLINVDDTWMETLAAVGVAAKAAGESLASLAKSDDPSGADVRARAIVALAAVETAATKIAAQDRQMAAWVSESKSGRCELTVAPVDVSGLLAATLWSNLRVIATSATLKHAGSLDGYARRVGAYNTSYSTSDVPSPFDYRANSYLYVAKHLPEPRSAAFAQSAADHVVDLVRAAGGRTLSLHTSYKAMQYTAGVLRSALADSNIRVLMQGEASRDVLIGSLRDAGSSADRGVVVCATQSFWTGVDVAGSGLTCVVIDKLPFARPTDPLSVARRNAVEARGGNSFAEIDIPHAATLLAQGAGRLIRAVGDRGVVAVLDQRLATKPYRHQLLGGLPPFRRTVDTEDVCAFLSKISAAAHT